MEEQAITQTKRKCIRSEGELQKLMPALLDVADLIIRCWENSRSWSDTSKNSSPELC